MSRDLMELSPQMPWVSDPAGNMLAVGAKWTEWTGMPREEALGQGWRAGYHPRDLAAKTPLMEEAWRTGKPYEGRSRMRCRDGGYRWVRVRAYPKLGENGQIIRWYGLAEDIHDHVEAEERLRESEEHYRHTVELHPQMPWTADRQGQLLTVDERMRERTAVDPVEARGEGWLKIAHPDDEPAIRAAMAHSMATGEPYSVKYRARMADHSYRWVHAQAYPRRNAAGEIIRWYGSNADIHEQELVQLRLAESEARLRLAQDAAGIGIWDVDLVTDRATLSPRSLEMLGVPGVPGDAAGTYAKAAWAELIHPDDRAEAMAATQRSVETGEPFDHTYRVQLPDGGTRWIQGLGRTERDDTGQPVRMIGVKIDVTARVEAERAVRKAEERFRLAARATRNLIYDWNAATDSVQWSEAISSHFGYALESVCPAVAWWEDKVHPDDREQAAASLQAAIDGDAETWAAEYRFRRADGAYADIYERGSFVRDEQGKVVRMVGAMLDRTEWKEAENRLRESEARFRQMADNAPVMIWVTEAGGMTSFISRGWCEFTGQSETEALGSGWVEAVHPDDRDQALDTFLAAAAANTTYRSEYRLRRADGAYRWILDATSPRMAADGSFVGYIGSAIDITDRKAAESRLRESEERLRLALEAGELATWDWSLVTGESVWSDRFYRLLGYETGAVPTTYEAWQERVHPDDRAAAEAAIAEAIQTGDQFSAEYRERTANGDYIWLSSFGRTERAADGTPLRMVGVLRDITERKAAEAELERAHLDLLRLSRLSAMGAMASTLAHEINQPLAATVQYLAAAEMLLERDPADPKVREVCSLAGAEAMRAGTIIRRIRNFAQGGHIARKAEDLERIIDQSIAIVKARPDAGSVTFIKNVEPDARSIEVDAIQIEQVLTNLIRNSVEAMVDSPIRCITLTARCRHDKIDLFIADTGPGLPAEMHRNLFQPLSSSKSEGLGLGLSICRTIVEAHDGHMWAEAPNGGGAVIAVSVPAPNSVQVDAYPATSKPD